MHAEQDSTATRELLERIAAGDRAAVDDLLANWRVYLRQVIDLRMDAQLRARLDPSDVVQETQLEVANRLGDYIQRRPASLRLWLRRTAIENLARLERFHLATQKRAVSRELPLADHSSVILARYLAASQSGDPLVRQENAEQMRTAMARLSEQDREVLLLRHVEELSNGEIAELLGIDTAAASKRYGRALRRLHEALKTLGIGDS
jgi:RNA polymerase sigma-70 factor (ECF subfamily)